MRKNYLTATVVAAISLFPAVAVQAALQGSGTAASPYLVNSAADLVEIDSLVNAGKSQQGIYFLQTADIDVTGSTFDGIGSGTDKKKTFAGVYDGGGHAVHNLKIDGIGYDASGKAVLKQSNQNAAFVAVLGKGGVVSNLTIASDCSLKAFMYAAGIAGTSSGRVENCRNYGTVVAVSKYAAGLVGNNGGQVLRCYNAGKIVAGFTYAAGIAASSSDTVAYCQNDGPVSAEFVNSYKAAGAQYGAAGIVCTVGQTAVIADNINSGSVTAPGYSGGIITSMPMYGATIVRNVNYGAVGFKESNGYNHVGAIVGTEPNRDGDFESNYYDGQIGYFGAAGGNGQQGCEGVLTRSLTSGQALEGLDNSLIDYQAGSYPVLKAFKDEALAKANRQIIVTFDDADRANDVKSPATLASAAGLSWAVKPAGTASLFAVSGNKLTVGEAGDAVATDTLVATLGATEKRIPVRALSYSFTGQGTASDPFVIANKDDMLKLADYVNTKHYTFEGKYVKVTADIDFGETTYVPVGPDGDKFDGDFDGAGHKFLNINYTGTKTQGYRALFANVGSHARVHGVVLQSGTLSAYRGTAGIAGKVFGVVDSCENHANITTFRSSSAGGIAGMVWNGGTVRNCKNYGSVDAYTHSYNGGIAYYVAPDGLIEHCENYADVTATKGTCGGIASDNDGTVAGCVNYGTIRGSSAIGGIVGLSDYNARTVHCVNKGTIAGATSYGSAGIVGATIYSEGQVVRIDSCVNLAAVSGNNQVGGIVGRVLSQLQATGNENYGKISTTAGDNAGGIAGLLNALKAGSITLSNNFNAGEVQSAAAQAGGIAGVVPACATIDGAHNVGQVHATTASAGGIAGSVVGAVSNACNTGDVKAASAAGGIAGEGSGATIGHVYSVGTVQATDSAGCLIGQGTANLADAFFLQGGNQPSSADGQAQAVTLRALVAANLGSAFEHATGMLPTLVALRDNQVANWSVAVPVLAEGDDTAHVSNPFVVGNPAGTVWTSSESLEIEGGTVNLLATDASAWITKTCGNFSKTYRLSVKVSTGVNDIDGSASVMSVEYYGMNGSQLGSAKPVQSGIYVKRMVLSNGQVVTRKVLVK